jgi:hypothetical protein
MRSSGHILLSLLPISGRLSRSLISCLLFCAVRFLCFFASVTYGMRLPVKGLGACLCRPVTIKIVDDLTHRLMNHTACMNTE